MSLRRSAILNLATQGIGILLVFVQGIVLVPYYVKSIPVPVYGTWLALTNVLSWFEMADPGVSAALGQRVAFSLGQQRHEGLSEVIGSGLLLAVAMACLPLLALPFAGEAPSWVGYGGTQRGELSRAFAWAIVSVSVALMSYGVTAVCVGLHLSGSAGLVYLGGSAAGIAVTVWALREGRGILALPAGSVVRSSILLIGNGGRLAAWLAIARAGAPRVSRRELREILAMTGYSAFSRAAAIVLTRMDAFLCARFVSPNAAVVLSLTGRAFDVARMAAERMGIALSPGLTTLLGEGRQARAREVLERARSAAAVVSALGFGGVIALNEGFVGLWVGPGLFGGLGLTVTTGLAAAVASSLALVGQALFAAGGVKQTSILTTAEAIVRLGLQSLLLWSVGVAGIPVAAVVAALAVGAGRIPPLIAERFGGPPSRFAFWWPVARVHLIGGVLGLGIALGVRGMAPSWTWSRFALLAVAAAAMMGAAFYAADQGARELARAVAVQVRQRLGALPRAAQKGS